jgi:hypothetical protein
MGTAYRYLGLATLATGRCAEALIHFQKSLDVFGEYFKGWDIARTLIYMGHTHLLSGRHSEARSILLDALRIAGEVHSSPLMLETITELASLEMQRNAGRAAGWLWLVKDHPATTQETKDRACQLLRDAERDLNAEEIQVIKAGSTLASLEALAAMLTLQ